jgi:hypothetical protein
MSEYEEKTPEEVEELLLLLADFSSEGKRSKKRPCGWPVSGIVPPSYLCPAALSSHIRFAQIAKASSGFLFSLIYLHMPLSATPAARTLRDGDWSKFCSWC